MHDVIHRVRKLGRGMEEEGRRLMKTDEVVSAEGLMDSDTSGPSWTRSHD